jgi:hypothetical protein
MKGYEIGRPVMDATSMLVASAVTEELSVVAGALA